MICRKCDALATLVIRKEYWYCDKCFLINTNHKFRACLGKNKTITSNEKILICLSGGPSSTVLLDLIHTGINLKDTKTLRIIPYFLHIIETATVGGTVRADSIIELCKKYGFEVFIENINDYHSSTNNTHTEPNVPRIDLDTFNKDNLNTSTTINNDVIIKIKRQLYLRMAKKLQCQTIFTAETTTQLAKRLLSNLAFGRGSQVENDVGFADKRDQNIKILRPMRDISNEEIDHFVKVKQLAPVYDNNTKKNSLQSIIDNFVFGLQQNYPSTISTVCKTADKIGSLGNIADRKKCTLCQSTLILVDAKLTALDATLFSRQMCFSQAGANEHFEAMQSSNEDKNSMFPSINETLCYSCSRNFSELYNNCKLSVVKSVTK